MCNLTPIAAENRLVQRLQSSVCPCRVHALHGPDQFAIHRPVWGQMVKYHVLVPARVITLLWVLASSVYRCWLFSDRDSTVVVCLLWSADNPGWSWSLAGYVTWRDDVIAGACSRRGDWWIDTLWIVAPVCVAVVCIFILALIIVLTRYQNNLENAGDNSRKSLETRKIRLPFLFV